MRWRGKSFPCPTWCGPPIAKPPGRSGPFKSDTPQKCYQYRGCCNDGQAFCCSVGECCSDRRSTGKEVPERAGSRQWGCSAKGVAGAYPPQPPHSLFLTLVGITEKPGVVDGHIAIREYLSLTVSLDHDIIDGAPAARFVTRLKELIESGFGLLDQEVIADQASTTALSC